jgi:hypothetical protein
MCEVLMFDKNMSPRDKMAKVWLRENPDFATHLRRTLRGILARIFPGTRVQELRNILF